MEIDKVYELAEALEDITFDVIANAYTCDNKGADKERFKAELGQYGVSPLVATKLYVYLSKVAEELNTQSFITPDNL